MKKGLLIAFLAAFVFSQAQVFIPSAETAFEQQHHFNAAFIKSRGIRKIVFDIIDKKDFLVAEDKNLTETYEFDQEGRLSRYYYTVLLRTVEKQTTVVGHRGKKVTHSTRTTREFEYDTISTNYYYDGKNLVLRRYHDGKNFYEARYFRYDSEGGLTKELRFRETNASQDNTVFMLGSQVKLSEDSFQYERYGNKQVHCISLNDERRPYKKKIQNLDSAGRTVHISEYYTAASWITQEQDFKYEKGKLASATFSGNAGNKIALKNLYEYDETGELYGEKQFRNDVLTREVSYVTDTLNKLLNSFVIRDHINKTIRIVKLRYDLGMIGSRDFKNSY